MDNAIGPLGNEYDYAAVSLKRAKAKITKLNKEIARLYNIIGHAHALLDTGHYPEALDWLELSKSAADQ